MQEKRVNYPDTLDRFAADPSSTLTKINHPQIRTGYPPLAQAVFALNHLIAPFSVWSGDLSGNSGFVKAAWLWENKSGDFRLILNPTAEIAAWFDLSLYRATRIARWVVGAIYLVWLGYLTIRPATDAPNVGGAWLLAVAAVFLLSPTQFPWYFTWLLPVLVVRPMFALLLYTPLLPLYYLQYAVKPVGIPSWLDYDAVVWLEHAPIGACLIATWASRRSKDMHANHASPKK